MKNIFFFLIIISLYSFMQTSDPMEGSWMWVKTTDAENKYYYATPKDIGSTKKLVFTSDGKVITYKNNIEIRISKYEITKGVSVFDTLTHDMVTYEGITYVIEKLDVKNLVLINNSLSNTYRSSYIKTKK